MGFFIGVESLAYKKEIDYFRIKPFVMKEGDKAKASPELTGLIEWVEGVIINVRTNPFLGTEIAIKDNLGRIYFGEAKYFKSVEYVRN